MAVSELVTRILSSVVLVLLVLSTYWKGGAFFYAFLMIVAAIQYFELFGMTKKLPITFLLGLFLIALPCGALAQLYSTNENALVWLAFCIWSSDVFCYLVGRKYGKTRIAPSISPGKTWLGLLGGTIACTVIGIACAYWLELPLLYYIVSPLIAALSQLGDFLESLLKRVYRVKNSGKLIPGHGGVMDRLDGFILCAPLVAWLL